MVTSASLAALSDADLGARLSRASVGSEDPAKLTRLIREAARRLLEPKKPAADEVASYPAPIEVHGDAPIGARRKPKV